MDTKERIRLRGKVVHVVLRMRGGQSAGASSGGTYSEEHARLVARMKQVVR